MALREKGRAVILFDSDKKVLGVFSSLKLLIDTVSEKMPFVSYSKLSKERMMGANVFEFEVNGIDYRIEILPVNEMV